MPGKHFYTVQISKHSKGSVENKCETALIRIDLMKQKGWLRCGEEVSIEEFQLGSRTAKMGLPGTRYVSK